MLGDWIFSVKIENRDGDRFTQDIDLSVDNLQSALAEQAFKPCASMDFSRIGWVSPLGRDNDMPVHAVPGD